MLPKEIFSSRLHTLRIDRGISLRDLGNVLGVSDEAVRLMERSKRLPSFESLTALADFFDVPLDFLAGRPPFDNWEAVYEQRSTLLDVISKLTRVPVDRLNQLSLSALIRIYPALFGRIEFDPVSNTLDVYPLIPPDSLNP